MSRGMFWKEDIPEFSTLHLLEEETAKGVFKSVILT